MRSFFEAISVSCVIPAQSPADDERTVFENLSFAVERGEIVDLVGPSGSGKSSLLTACARLNPHAHGTFALEGKGSGEFTPQQWRRDVAYLPQKPILTGKNVAEAIRLPWTLAIRSKGGKAEQLLPDERIRTTLDAMGCEDIDLERATRHGDHPHPPPPAGRTGHPHADAGQGAADRTRDDGSGGAGRERGA